MSQELDAAKRYRVHAKELRVIAEQDRDYETRRMLLKVADDYEHMANTLEAIDKTNKAVHRPRNKNT
jgi:bacterioferritin (cytochrome b1)